MQKCLRRTEVFDRAFYKKLAVSKGRAFGRSPQWAKYLIRGSVFWKVAEVLRTSAKTLLQVKKFSQAAELYRLFSKIIRWMIFDGWVWNLFTYGVKTNRFILSVPACAGALTCGSTETAFSLYRFFYFYIDLGCFALCGVHQRALPFWNSPPFDKRRANLKDMPDENFYSPTMQKWIIN